MVETVFLDWALAFGAGLLFGVAGRNEVASARSLFSTRAFRWGLVYLHVGVLAISVSLYALHPAWMWMYWVNPASLPLVVVVMVFLLYEVCFIGGFTLAAELERRWRGSTLGLAGVLFVAINAAEFATRVRLFHFGTFEEFVTGRAPLGIDLSPFRLEPAMAIVLGPGLLATAAVVIVLLRLYRHDVRQFGGNAAVRVATPEYTAS